MPVNNFSARYMEVDILKSLIQRGREVNVSFWAQVSHSNFSRSLAEHYAGRIVPVAIVGNKTNVETKATRHKMDDNGTLQNSHLEFRCKAESLGTQLKHKASLPVWNYLPWTQ